MAFARAPPPVGDPIATPFSSSKEVYGKFSKILTSIASIAIPLNYSSPSLALSTVCLLIM